MNKKNLQPILFAILSGLLLVFSYPTFPYAIFAWFALVPLLLAIEEKSLWRTAQLGFITGFIYFYGILYWLNVLYKFSWLVIPGLVLLAGYLALYIVAFVVILNWLFPKQNYTRLLISPILWVSIEYFRQIGYLGFSWGILGYTQWQNLPLIQISSLTSVLGISFLIILVNSGITYLVQARPCFASTKKILPIILGIITLLISVVLYGYYQIRVHTNESDQRLKVAVIQGNILQDLKWDEQLEKEHQEIHFQLSETVAQQEQPDLIVWPETAITEFLAENPTLISRFKDLAKKYQTTFLIGSPDIEPVGDKSRIYTSAFLIDANQGIVKKYDKTALVPFGEYVPLGNQFPFLKQIIQGPGDFDAGTKYTQFELYSHTSIKFQFTSVICFESTMSHLVRRFMVNPADFLVIITNDAWFGKTEALYQHAYMAVFRAVENRTDIVRSANTGYSCFINPVGKIQRGLKVYQRGFLVDEIQARKSRTFYTQYGDVFAHLCIGLTLILGILKTKKFATKARKHEVEAMHASP
ncbi:MAG: apolipoprotein N-acyltransferase, partial [bacterium]|nr:apolipoprotein N-acyltransferase [bacterium]